jgi:hypothetical protein
LQLLEIPHDKFRRGRLGGVGVLFNDVDRTVTAVLPLALRLPESLDPAYCQRVAAAWQQAVSALLSSRVLVKRVGWTTRVVRPVAAVELLLTEELQREFPDLASIDSLLMVPESIEWPRVPMDQTFVSVTVDARRAPVDSSFGADIESGAVEALLIELDAVARGLKHFNFSVGAPLSPGELVQYVHVCADPSLDADQNLERGQLLSEAVGVVPTLDAPPEVDTSDWNFARFNESYHRAYWVAEWPPLYGDGTMPHHPLMALRPEVPGIQTVAGMFSRAGVSDAPLAHLKAGFEASLRDAVPQQVALVVLAAPSTEHLAIQSNTLEAAGLKAGFEFRPLHGRHDHGLLASLPYGLRFH